CAVVKNGFEVTNADAIVLLEDHFLNDGLVIDKGAIAAQHVLDEPLILMLHEARVLPADRGRRYGDIAIGASTHNDGLFFQREALSGIGSFANQEMSHGNPQ